ncbi:MAG: hypothetical protein WC621_02265 [Patescibacteria group bacterium]
MKFLQFSQTKLGSSLMLRANGQGGSSATVLAAHFAKRNTKFGGGGKARTGKNSFPPTPFLFARPSLKVFQNSAFGFSLKKVRISFSVRSQIVCCEFIASALRASAGRLYSICQDFLGSIATFCESKTRFAVAKQRINEVYEPILLFPPKAESKAIIFNSPKTI